MHLKSHWDLKSEISFLKCYHQLCSLVLRLDFVLAGDMAWQPCGSLFSFTLVCGQRKGFYSQTCKATIPHGGFFCCSKNTLLTRVPKSLSRPSSQSLWVTYSNAGSQ